LRKPTTGIAGCFAREPIGQAAAAPPRRRYRFETMQMKKAIEKHAEQFVRDYGDAAFDKAQEAVRDAHRRRNNRLERYLTKVAREIAHRMPDSGTRLPEPIGRRIMPVQMNPQ
jgi:hypothetical protein